MNLDVIIPIMVLIGILILILPGFLQTNFNLKIFVKNFLVWLMVILIILIFVNFIL